MKVTLDREAFVDGLLSPASKLSDNIEIKITKDKATALVASADYSVILQAVVPCSSKEERTCIIPDCKAFLRLFTCISDPEIELEIKEATVCKKATKGGIAFKYHLLDEAYYSTKKGINAEKLSQIKFDTSFVIAKEKFQELIKFNSIIPDAEKLYFYPFQDEIHAKIGDNQKETSNEISTAVCKEFEGEPLKEELPLNMQSILLMSFRRNNIQISINQKLKLFQFMTDHGKYIISGLVK